MDIIFQESPLQARLLVPLIHLAEILSHKQKFLSRMTHHKAVGGAEVRELLLLGIPRHLTCQRTFSVDHLVVGKYQDELLAVGIEHAEGQLPVVVMAEIWIALHVIQEIVHPAHVPLEVESKSAIVLITGDLRPGRGLFSDQDRTFRVPRVDGI